MKQVNNDEELLLKILQALNRIENKLDSLDVISSLIKLDKRESIEDVKTKFFAKSALRRSIYNLCDGKHTVSDIAKELNKSISLISQSIAQLQKFNLIKEERKGRLKYYYRVF